MRRTSIAGLSAVLVTVLVPVVGLPAATAAGGDQADSLHAAKQGAASPTGRWLHENLGSASDQDWFRFTMASAGRALVTLGHLPDDYDLRVYDAAGDRVARSDHPGRRFEQLYKPFAAGDYFVRVTTSAGVDPSVDYALKFRPLPAAMVIAEQRDVGDVDGFDIKGELLNNTSQWRQVLRLHVTWLDKDGNAVGTHDEGIIPGPVAPRTRVQFDVVERYADGDVPASARSYRIRVDDQLTDQRTPAGLVMKPGSKEETDTQRLYRGTVTNTSNQTMRDVYPTVIEYDSLGRAIAFGFDHIKTLAAGKSVDYLAAINTGKLPKLNGVRQFASITGT